MKIRHLAFAALFATMPFISALAQSPGLNLPADSQKGQRAVEEGASPGKPATGATVAPGSNSTVAGDRKATTESKTGSSTGNAGGSK